MKTIAGIIFFIIPVLGCSSSESNNNNTGTEGGPCYANGTCNSGLVCASNLCVRLSDSGVVADQGIVDSSLVNDVISGPKDTNNACDMSNYPCGPYGINEGEISENYRFQGYIDPENFCKDNAQETLDLNQLKYLSLSHRFLRHSR